MITFVFAPLSWFLFIAFLASMILYYILKDEEKRDSLFVLCKWFGISLLVDLFVIFLIILSAIPSIPYQ